MMRLLVIIPAFNEEEHIGEVIKSIPKKIPGISEIKVVVIDDGSTDNTVKTAEASGAMVIQNYFNRGLGVTFNRGLQYAIDNNFDGMVNIDADGQFAPEDIVRLLKPIQNNEADFVTGSRFIDKNYCPKMPLIKFWGNKMMAYWISRLIGRKFYDVSCGFRAYSKEALLSLNLQGKFTYTQEAFLNLAFKRLRIREVPIKVEYSANRRSKIAPNVFTYGLRTAKIIFRTYRDYKPLTFFVRVGTFFFLGALFFEAILFFTYLTRGTFTPHIWSGFVGAVFLFISIAFFVIGIFADMNDRIRLNQEKILYYLKKQKINRKS